MQRIVLATNNAHKIEELSQILQDYPFDWKTLKDFPASQVPDETGATYLENALIKARASCHETGFPALADDSGLEVDALGGKPGLHSARFGGPGTTHAQKIQLLLSELSSTAQRDAQFRCVIAVVHPDGREWWSEGICQVFISEQPTGHQGFGYDPVFWIPKYQKTMAQLSSETKNRISHRAHALHQVMHALYESATSYPQL